MNNPLLRGPTGPANADSFVPEGPRQSTLAREPEGAPLRSGADNADFANGFVRERPVGNEGNVNQPLGSNFNPEFGGVGNGMNFNQGTFGGPPFNNPNQNGSFSQGTQARPSENAPIFDGSQVKRSDPNDNSNRRQDFDGDSFDTGDENSGVAENWGNWNKGSNNAGSTGETPLQKIDPFHGGVEVGAAPGAQKLREQDWFG